MRLIKLVSCAVFVLSAASCGTSGQVSAAKGDLRQSTRAIVGTALIGARGATPADQDRIDDTAAGICAAGVWRPAECQAHGAR